MPYVSIFFGLLLIALGGEAYTNQLDLFHVKNLHSPTALIPLYFGVALILCGWIELGPAMLDYGMEAAAVISLIGFIAAGAMGFRKLPAALRGELENSAGPKVQSMMAALCGIFFLFCVRAFIAERRALRNQPPTNPTPQA